MFPHRFLYRFLIDFCFQLRPPGSQKNVFFQKEKQGFFKKTPFEDNIDFGFDFGANLPPCWPPKSKIFRNYGLPRGLQNVIVFASIFYRFGVRLDLQHGPILGGKTVPNSKKWVQKVGTVASQERS